MKKTIFVFSGPSGSGKSTLIERALKNFKNVVKIVTCTTRPPRDYEINGKHYNFISLDEFEKAIGNDDFLEHVECYGNKYGTLKSSVRDVLRKCDACVLDLEFAGAYKALHGEIFEDVERVGILILPPSIKALKKRLIDRKSESEKSFAIRLNDSFNVPKIGNYKHIIINKTLNASQNELVGILEKYLS